MTEPEAQSLAQEIRDRYQMLRIDAVGQLVHGYAYEIVCTDKRSGRQFLVTGRGALAIYEPVAAITPVATLDSPRQTFTTASKQRSLF